ncbi:hypothetical protein EDC94DRAFT_601874 [Helicostylum pulchrum]|nr:hypothetical protein EDC94DRAFT_601874 [Helicostylum pulchrum]
MSFSTAQSNISFNNLLEKIEISCQIHFERQLSICGRVTVLNTLILSRLWHVLLIFSLTRTQLAKICGIASCFINNNSSISIGFQAACLPRSAGGLGFIYPKLQILKIQWRWQVSLFQKLPSSPIDSSLSSPPNKISHPYSKFLLTRAHSFASHSLPRPSYVWPLLFSTCRPSYLTQSPLKPFLHIIDSVLCRAYDNIFVKP